jgi:predicted DNA binding CopG/RHH family protein
MLKQNSEIRFKCSTEELQKIKLKASSCGMTLKSYILYLCKNSKVKVEVE